MGFSYKPWVPCCCPFTACMGTLLGDIAAYLVVRLCLACPCMSRPYRAYHSCMCVLRMYLGHAKVSLIGGGNSVGVPTFMRTLFADLFHTGSVAQRTSSTQRVCLVWQGRRGVAASSASATSAGSGRKFGRACLALVPRALCLRRALIGNHAHLDLCSASLFLCCHLGV